MIVSNIVSGVKKLFNSGYNRGSFVIYNAEALTSPDKNTLQSYQLLAFDGFTNLGYNNNVMIPKQSLENRQFSNDSIINNPFRLSLTCPISQQLGTSSDMTTDYEGNITTALEYIGKSNLLLVIFRTAPLFNTYSNMHLESWNYAQSPDNTGLFINMNFEEINTSYIPNSQNNSPINGVNTTNNFSPSNSSNPANQKPIDNGIINTYTPDGNINSIQPSNGKVLN